MNIALVNHFDSQGGAARAAYRLHHALRDCGVNSRMYVCKQTIADPSVQGPTSFAAKLYLRLGAALMDRLLNSRSDGGYRSLAILPGSFGAAVKRDDIDIVHLHWINAEMMSISEVGAIKKPTVWTLHDMWAFCGYEHYALSDRWTRGYKYSWRVPMNWTENIDAWTWRRKKSSWKRPINIVCPSQWLATCVRGSALMKDWPVTVIPNAIDTETWAPVDRLVAREVLGLRQDVPLVMFGAWGGSRDPRKGFDLLQEALCGLERICPDAELVVLGQSAPERSKGGMAVHYIGHLHDDISLRLLYSAVDVVVIPSRSENLPNAGLEAHSCGTPVVAFATGGLPDVVDHLVTGYLAHPFDAEELGHGIQWVLEHPDRRQLRDAARLRAVSLWSNQAVGKRYVDLYQSIL
ncbi:glycosyltransferase family 4 protein [Ramlibacter rhizophilus]|uniref:Glycosyltransferase n=1 Tax=Ramlibacter rhizophilus TaxID=1781167 RepID=A0A4Z0C108_9BURK|nr:glycosyltransferase family 4 protein [Ramlibacter rhizophilus]TFZ04208.1 glycosyltransferase [Ramlibacter rhizophilus]